MSTHGPGGPYDPTLAPYRGVAQEPVRPGDPWTTGRETPQRRRIDTSLILAALVMVLLAVGVIVGVAML